MSMFRTVTVCFEKGGHKAEVESLMYFINYFWKDTQRAVSSGLLWVVRRPVSLYGPHVVAPGWIKLK